MTVAFGLGCVLFLASGFFLAWRLPHRSSEDEERVDRAARLIVESMPAHAWSIGLDGRFDYVSPGILRYLGFEEMDLALKKDGLLDRGAAYGEWLLQSVHPDDRREMTEKWTRAFDDGSFFFHEHRVRRSDGVYRWFRVSVMPVHGKLGELLGFHGTQIDVDEEKRSMAELQSVRAQLIQSSRRANLAELSASIAHEVNQPLGALLINAQICRRWLSAEPPNIVEARLRADGMVQNSRQAIADIERNRLLFQRGENHFALIDILPLIAEVIQVIDREASPLGVRIALQLGDRRTAMVFADAVQLRQLLENLVRNALEASDCHAGAVVDVRVSDAADGDGTILSVGDGGAGIADKTQLFEPFFTTKPQHMGLGLSICRSIAEAHGGRLWAEDNKPRGALFSVWLPAPAPAREESD
ncbi:MAG: PAS domain-containing sensor histidine kinase [Sphingopyxis sp.]|nr:PAS domain-containing sensor histidine kinase [Sphingopyxis sp.]